MRLLGANKRNYNVSVKLPWDLDTEKAVLGCAFDDQESCAIVCQLQPEDFFEQRHRTILGAIQKVASTGAFVDELSVSNELKRQDKDYAVGGMAYLVGLHGEITSTIYLRQWIRDLQQLATIRRVAEAANKIANEAHGKRSASELCDFALKEILGATHVAERREPRSVLDITRDILDAIIDKEARIARPRYRTGFAALDEKLAPLEGGQLILIAARPSAGKTSLALHLAQRMASAGAQTLFFSLETTATKIVKRTLSQLSSVELVKITSESINGMEVDKIVRAAESFVNLPFYVDDAYNLTVPRLQAICRRHAAQYGSVGAVLIDYVQLVEATHRSDSREREVADVSRGLKALAKEFDVPVIALSQLNRDSEKSGEVNNGQLRNSGQLEQDADAILLMRRANETTVDVNISKQKDGPTGPLKLAFDGPFVRFADLDAEPEPIVYRTNVPATRDPREPSDYDF